MSEFVSFKNQLNTLTGNLTANSSIIYRTTATIVKLKKNLSASPKCPLGNPLYNNRFQNITPSNLLLIHRIRSASSHPILTRISSHQRSGVPSYRITTYFP